MPLCWRHERETSTGACERLERAHIAASKPCTPLGACLTTFTAHPCAPCRPSTAVTSRARRLFHVDDDELLYFNEPFNKIIARLPPEVSCVVLVNVEAVPKTLDADCVFSVISPVPASTPRARQPK